MTFFCPWAFFRLSISPNILVNQVAQQGQDGFLSGMDMTGVLIIAPSPLVLEEPQVFLALLCLCLNTQNHLEPTPMGRSPKAHGILPSPPMRLQDVFHNPL